MHWAKPEEACVDAEVVIVGAGPTGMMLAGELRLAGTDVIVIERLSQRSGESRGLGFTTRTVEVFDQRGLLSKFGDIEVSNLGHFGGIPLDFGVLEDAPQAAKTVPQSQTETVLEEWARELGAVIRRGDDAQAVRDLGDRVAVDCRGVGGDYTLNAAYVVGCDGGRSMVRKEAGFAFPGTAATMEMYLADVRGLDDLRPRMIGETVPGGMIMAGHLPGGITRLIVCERGTPPRRRTAPPEYAEVAEAWKRLTGDDISQAEPVWISAFGDATRQVTEYRRGRVFLAGDAAHIHLPAGGQGMNTGIQDAVNLGWKLGAVTAGRAPQSLLDTYHGERFPVGKRLLTNTQAQGLLFLSGSEMGPLREVFAELTRYPEVARHLAGMVSGLEIEYDMGGGTSPLLGKRMPRLDLEGHPSFASSTEALRTGRGVLFDLADSAQLRRRAAGWAGLIDTVTAKPAASGQPGWPGETTAVLVRPDGHVAWAAPGTHYDLPMALRRWFGEPR
jgi:bifunctional hydroxylase/dehydrase